MDRGRSGLTCALLVWTGVAIAGCAKASADDDSGPWMRVLSDSNYVIAIDTSRTRRLANGWLEVWYRTNHAVTHLHHGKPFNREIVQSYLRCGNMSFRIAAVDMSLGTNRPISQQRTEWNDLVRQPWRQVERGAVEEIAALAACQFAARRATH